MSAKAVTIVIPVYGDWPSLGECVESLKQHVDTTRDRVMLVNDCGPEVELMERNIKAAIKGLKGFEYFRNPKNLGFIGNCNRAVLELDKTDNDILLLNSDTKVTKGFLDEMRSVLYDQKNIGTVSPRSNNATICTFPLAAIRKQGIEAEKSYALFSKYRDKFPRYNRVPTAHGFCLLIRRTIIKEQGLFDKIFGKGYGEEVDFCQRIQKHGWVCVLSNRSYVFHLEARSFTPETKKKLLEANNLIVRKRYPTYQQSVRDYIDKALITEKKISRSLSLDGGFRDFVKQNRHLHRLAKMVRRTR